MRRTLWLLRHSLLIFFHWTEGSLSSFSIFSFQYFSSLHLFLARRETSEKKEAKISQRQESAQHLQFHWNQFNNILFNSLSLIHSLTHSFLSLSHSLTHSFLSLSHFSTSFSYSFACLLRIIIRVFMLDSNTGLSHQKGGRQGGWTRSFSLPAMGKTESEWEREWGEVTVTVSHQMKRAEFNNYDWLKIDFLSSSLIIICFSLSLWWSVGGKREKERERRRGRVSSLKQGTNLFSQTSIKSSFLIHTCTQIVSQEPHSWLFTLLFRTASVLLTSLPLFILSLSYSLSEDGKRERKEREERVDVLFVFFH